MSWELPWVKKPGIHGGFVIASVHQNRNEADITDTYMDSAYVCAEHADMIVKAVNNHDALVDGLLASKIAHYECEDDPFFSCHATQSSISHYDDPQISYKPEPICNCGADAHNKRIDDLMAKVNQ